MDEPVANGAIAHDRRDHGFAIQRPPTRRSINGNGQTLGTTVKNPA
jgi:hypothetical protein